MKSIRPNFTRKQDFRNKSGTIKVGWKLSESKNYTRGKLRMAWETQFSIKKDGKTQSGSKVKANTTIMSRICQCSSVKAFSTKLNQTCFQCVLWCHLSLLKFISTHINDKQQVSINKLAKSSLCQKSNNLKLYTKNLFQMHKKHNDQQPNG